MEPITLWILIALSAGVGFDMGAKRIEAKEKAKVCHCQPSVK